VCARVLGNLLSGPDATCVRLCDMGCLDVLHHLVLHSEGQRTIPMKELVWSLSNVSATAVTVPVIVAHPVYALLLSAARLDHYDTATKKEIAFLVGNALSVAADHQPLLDMLEQGMMGDVMNCLEDVIEHDHTTARVVEELSVAYVLHYLRDNGSARPGRPISEDIALAMERCRMACETVAQQYDMADNAHTVIAMFDAYLEAEGEAESEAEGEGEGEGEGEVPAGEAQGDVVMEAPVVAVAPAPVPAPVAEGVPAGVSPAVAHVMQQFAFGGEPAVAGYPPQVQSPPPAPTNAVPPMPTEDAPRPSNAVLQIHPVEADSMSPAPAPLSVSPATNAVPVAVESPNGYPAQAANAYNPYNAINTVSDSEED
ncbi:hypothetical protein KIPB_003347, partial [Kipferlia bialata]